MSRGIRSIRMSLPLQMVSMVVVLVIFSVSAIGIPSILVMRDQLDRQAWLLVEQGSQMTHTLLSSRGDQLVNLAILTAQRPSLLALLQQNDREELTTYLRVLQAGADLDLVLLCDAEKQPVAQAGLSISAEACSSVIGPVESESSLLSTRLYYELGESGSSAWLLAAHPISGLPVSAWVIVGYVFNQGLLEELYQQTGVKHILFVGNHFLASNLPDGESAWKALSSSQETNGKTSGSSTGSVAALQEGPYYTVRSRFEDSDLEMIALLPVLNIKQVQRQFTWTFAGGIIAVIFITSLLVFLLAKRIGLPLESLRNSATALRWGNLSTPISIKTNVAEITQVASALEDARIHLLHSLTTLRKEKEWTDLLLESVVEGIVTLDRHNRVTFFSTGAERISGWTQDQVLGKRIDDVFQLSSNQGGFYESLPAPGGKQALISVLGNNRRVTLAVTSARLAPPDAGKTGMAFVLRDISSEEAIHRLLGDFLANITHEFRTPLAALAASIELLMDQLPSLSQAELRELLVSLRLGILGLQTLIDNLLEGASIEAGRFRVHPRLTDLGEVIREIVRTMQPLLEKYNLRLALHIPEELPVVWADPRRTGQVLVNLLSNAIKMGPEGSEISLDVSVTEREVKVIVGDQGPGIPPGQRTDIFSRFAHTRQDDHRSEHGAGLGLSVVKAIVEAQEGQVGIMDGPDTGAVFWFTLPVADRRPRDEEKRP